ncbi:YeeE/YedE [Calothrix sp. 336/3]|nr:YeeE/YedE [Calothrix sp. 336/3]
MKSPNNQPQKLLVAIAIALFTFGSIVLHPYSWRHSILLIIGGLLGASLYKFRFGFTSTYRKFLTAGEVEGIYAQLLMLVVATILFAPVLAAGNVLGEAVKGSIAPIGIQGAIAAFLFGVGMQIAGGCGCGTLYAVGSGSLAMVFTLLTFCIGSFWASLTRQFWANLPTLPPIVLGEKFGWFSGAAIQVGICLLIFSLIYLKSDRKNQNKLNFSNHFSNCLKLPLFQGAIALAILNWLTLIVSGQPWRITWGFALFTAKIATFFGWDSTNSQFWNLPNQQKVLSASLFADMTTVTNIGILLGAFLAAALVGKLSLPAKINPRIIFSSALGGLLMGYGAFNAFGCNVNAFFGGIASTSLHGWVWIIFALLGSRLGLILAKLI